MIPLHPAQQGIDQATQLASAALQAPLNNLVAVQGLVSGLTLIVIIVAAWKFLPVILKQFQQLLDITSRLTDVSKQNSEQIAISAKALEKNTAELVRQTTAIENTNIEIRSQSLDFRNYQTLVSDGISNHSAQVEANTAAIVRFETTLNGLPEQLRLMITDELKCAGVEQSIQALRFEVQQILIQQAKKVTATIPIVPPPDNGITPSSATG